MPVKREARPMSEFFKFRNRGQAVAGFIDKFGHSGQFDTDFMVLAPIIIKQDIGSQPRLFGSAAIGLSADLLAKIDQRKDAGLYISVEFTGTEPSKKGSPKRIFDVNILSEAEFSRLESRATREFAGNAYQRDRDEAATDAPMDDDDLPF